MMDEPKTECRTPAKGRDGVTNIATWKYDAVRGAILSVLKSAGAEGAKFAELPEAVKSRLSADHLDKMGSVAWHTTSVKLNMEVEGEIKRLTGVAPQRLVMA